MLSKELKVRESFESTFKQIAETSRQYTEDVYRILVGSLDTVLKSHASGEIKWQRATQFFNVLLDVVGTKIAYRSATKGEDPALIELARTCISALRAHTSNETRTAVLIDSVLRGYLDVIRVIVASAHEELPRPRKAEEEPTPHLKAVLDVIEDTDLLTFLFKECLFSHEFANGQMRLSKCCSPEARKAAFGILDNYAKLLRPKEMSEYLNAHLVPLMKSVERPKGWRHKPSSGGRAHSHCGIVNLGCICYMISMLQQFFMVPQFRYQLLKAVDESPENPVEHKGEVIDDSLLRQL